MGTPPDSGSEGGGGWQSQWQPPTQSQGPWQQPEPPPSQPAQPKGNWQRAPDGSWVQVGGVQSSGKATAALVLGIIGLVFCPLICSVLALIFGYQARNEIDASGGRIGGRTSAVAGIVLGWIGVVIVGLFILLFIVLAAVGTDSDSSSPTDLPSVLVGHLATMVARSASA
jgi:Domain of unknown function (DUF4190)